MSRVIIANMSKSTLKIKKYGIMGKKKDKKITLAKKLVISSAVPKVNVLKNTNIIREPSPINRGKTVDVVSILCESRTSFWCERISLKMKYVKSCPMPGSREPITAVFGEK